MVFEKRKRRPSLRWDLIHIPWVQIPIFALASCGPGQVSLSVLQSAHHWKGDIAVSIDAKGSLCRWNEYVYKTLCIVLDTQQRLRDFPYLLREVGKEPSGWGLEWLWGQGQVQDSRNALQGRGRRTALPACGTHRSTQWGLTCWLRSYRQ